MVSSRSIVLSTATLCAVSILGYAFYFDHKRRNNVDFRKQLRKQKKQISKTKESSSANTTDAVTVQTMRAALNRLRTDQIPETPDAREQYFLQQVELGEQLTMRGPDYFVEAALTLFRALRVYPAPLELVLIYEKSLHPEIFKMVMQLTSLDVKDKVEGYYEFFPPKDMNVRIKRKEADPEHGQHVARYVLLATKDFEFGDVIYKETPTVATLDMDLASKGIYCSHCLRKIVKGMSLRPSNDPLESTYCSRDCQLNAGNQYHRLLFTQEPPIPEAADSITPESRKKRQEAQETLVQFLQNPKKQHTSNTILVARFLARYFNIELLRIKGEVVSTFGHGSEENYTLHDHLERIRYLEVNDTAEQWGYVGKVLGTATAGLEEFLTDEKFSVMLGKMAYNGIGICFSGGRDDRPESILKPEEKERTRTPYGTDRQIGTGLYFVSSYLTHSCIPNVRPSFSEGTSTMALIANRVIKEGEELSMAYVDVSRKTDETVVEARRRRREELALGWRFACFCQRCIDERPPGEIANGDVIIKDGSKMEDVVQRYENGLAGIPNIS